MKYRLFLCLLVMITLKAFGTGSQESRHLRNMSTAVSKDIQKTSIGRGDLLAIVTINNTTEDRASNITSSIETAIIKSGYVKLISRRHISEAINEINLGESGYIDDNSAAALGRFLGVTYIMIGDIIHNILTIQILEVETLHIVYSERFDVSFLKDSTESKEFRF